MKLPKTSYRTVAIITIVVSVIGLVMSPVSAAASFSSSGDPAGTPAGNSGYHHVFNSTQQAARLQGVLANLSQQGVDVSLAQADLAAGNITGAMKDLMALHNDHPGMMADSPQLATRLQTGVTRLAQQGVDVSGVQADLASGNVHAAMQWMAAYHTAHPSQNGNGTAWHSGNSTQWQQGGSFPLHHAGSGNQTASHQWFLGTGHRQPEHAAGA